MECVDKFMKCCQALKDKPKNEAKAKAQAYLSAMPEIVNSVGLGAKKGYWNFDSNKYDDLKDFLFNLR